MAASDDSTRTPSAITTALVVVSVIFPILSSIAIYLRVLAKRISRQPFHADDGWIIASWISVLPLSCLVWAFAAKSGVNYYKIDALHGTEDSVEMIFLASCFIQFPLSLVKISILLFHKRIFFPSRSFAIAVWVAIGTVVVWGILFFVLVLTQIDPISESWKGGPLRYDLMALGPALVGTSIALDFAVLCYPLPVISKLQMTSQSKLAVVFIFWLGAFCCVAAIMRLVFLLETLGQVSGNASYDYLSPHQFIFQVIEPNCSIIAACLPCYAPLVAKSKTRIPGFMVNSLRRLFTLRSNRFKQSTTKRAPIKAHVLPVAESQIELQWPGRVQQSVHCVGGSFSEDDAPQCESKGPGQCGISDTNRVTALRVCR